MDTFQFTPVYFIANFILYLLVFTAVMINCGSRLKTWLTVIIYTVSFAGSMAISWALPIHSLIRMVLGWLYVIIVAELLFKESWLFKLVTTSASILAMMLSDLIAGSMIPRVAMITEEVFRYSVPKYALIVFINIVLQTITVVFIRLIRKRSKLLAGRWTTVLFLIFPISQLAAIWLYFSAYKDFSAVVQSWKFLPVIIIYLLADVALVFSLWMSEKNVKVQSRNEMLEEQISFQKDYYAQLGASYEQIRKMRHDIDNHLYSIRVMLENGQNEEAGRYADELISNNSANTQFVTCENTVVTSFLEKRKEDLEKLGIELKCDIHMPRWTGISNPDLICAFGNIIDNAQEACSGLEQPEIVLRTDFSKPYLSINCENPVGDKKTEHRIRIPELERGLGMVILEDLAGQYDGELTTEAADNRFRTQIVLKGTDRDITEA